MLQSRLESKTMNGFGRFGFNFDGTTSASVKQFKQNNPNMNLYSDEECMAAIRKECENKKVSVVQWLLQIQPKLLQTETKEYEPRTKITCSCGHVFRTDFPIETDPGCDDCPKCGKTHYEKEENDDNTDNDE